MNPTNLHHEQTLSYTSPKLLHGEDSLLNSNLDNTKRNSDISDTPLESETSLMEISLHMGEMGDGSKSLGEHVSDVVLARDVS